MKKLAPNPPDTLYGSKNSRNHRAWQRRSDAREPAAVSQISSELELHFRVSPDCLPVVTGRKSDFTADNVRDTSSERPERAPFYIIPVQRKEQLLIHDLQGIS